MSEQLDYTIEFINKDFDVKSELALEFNAGNQIYGQDVAKYIEKELTEHVQEVEIIDEDWGWQVYGFIDADHKFDINIYAWGLLEDLPGDEFYLWRLLLKTKKKHKLFGVVPVYKSAKCNDDFCMLLSEIFLKQGFVFKRMETNIDW